MISYLSCSQRWPWREYSSCGEIVMMF